MKDHQPTVQLSAYTPPTWLVETVRLVFHLDPEATRVHSEIVFRPNPVLREHGDLWLDGRDLELVQAAVDGSLLAATDFEKTPEGIRVPAAHLPEGGFTWTSETRISPSTNTALEGLYMSKGMYCTQCEAQGFRKITYYPDRPDVMARFSVRIEGPAPVMLSNGNLVTEGAGYVEWEDPWPKPAYLFALVAGDLLSVDDSFLTKSGRDVALQIFVRPGDEHKCDYAMDALKRSMAWDETAYGREYDLDLFMIVAVDDFNMGAMENKGLNIFNSKYVLASPETATDADFENIEGIVAHEYFHNWTGNRITCRDWFQLCLKEGLTVYRDRQFTSDMRSAPVKRILDTVGLRSRQFREDAGPLAHPVRPEEYKEINNFYTSTVYEKGAEVISMLHLLVGDDAYRRALDLYFERHDGQACTIEDWLRVFEDTTGRDLGQFKLWYRQSGTPRLTLEGSYSGGTYRLRVRQSVPPTPGQPEKEPMLIPLSYAFFDKTGAPMGNPGLLEISKVDETFSFELPAEPVPSLLRNFSAPVILDFPQPDTDLSLVLAHDTDHFNRWEAARRYGMQLILHGIEDADAAPDPAYLDAIHTMLADDRLDPSFRALTYALPSREQVAGEMFTRGGQADPDAIERSLNTLADALAYTCKSTHERLFMTLETPGPYSAAAGDAARRALRLTALASLSRLDPDCALAMETFERANNMTESTAALTTLLHHVPPGAEKASLAFRERWSEDRLVMDKWFSMNALCAPPQTAVETATRLTGDPEFDWKNPNRFRSVLGGFAGNTTGFHRKDGAGYRFYADWLLKLDPVNPQTTARMSGAFETWKRYDPDRQRLIRAELDRIAVAPGLSNDLSEMVERMRAV